MNFEFATAGRVIFGRGASSRLVDSVCELGRRVFIVTGKDSARFAGILSPSGTGGLESEFSAVTGEPTIQSLQEILAHARLYNPDVIVGLGGGSAMDMAKGVAAMLANDGDLFDYLEVIGGGMPLRNQPIPCICVPTTAGTGSEVTRNSVLGSPEHRVKVSLRSPMMLPTRAIVDPCLTMSVAPDVTAYTGLDALTQVLEPFLSTRANPMTDALCREGLARAGRSIRRVHAVPDDLDAREDMALASLFGGMALANAGLGAVHGFAGPLGGMYAAPHGALCAALLPHVFEANHRAIAGRHRDSAVLPRFYEASQILTADPHATPEQAAEWLHQLVRDLDVPPLGRWGIREKEFPTAVRKSRNSSSMKGNPVDLTEGELTGILKAAF